VSEEVRDSRKSVPRTMVLSLISAALAVLLLQCTSLPLAQCTIRSSVRAAHTSTSVALITARPDLNTTSISAIFQVRSIATQMGSIPAEQTLSVLILYAGAHGNVSHASRISNASGMCHIINIRNVRNAG